MGGRSGQSKAGPTQPATPATATGNVTKESYLKIVNANSDYLGEAVNDDDYNYKTINAYTQGGYKVNDMLYKEKGDQIDLEFASNLSKALQKEPIWKGGTLYRGGYNRFLDQTTQTGKTRLDQLKENVGGTIEWKGFASTSKSFESMNKSFGNKKDQYLYDAKQPTSIHYYIEAKRGRDIEAKSGYKTEHEVLIDRNTKFKIQKVDGNKVYLEEIVPRKRKKK